MDSRYGSRAPRGRPRTHAILLAAACALLAASPIPAQFPGIGETPASDQAGDASGTSEGAWVTEARKEVAAALNALPEGAQAERRSLLRQQLDELERADRLLEERDNPAPVPAAGPPFSLRDLDATLARLQRVMERRSALEDAVRSAERVLERSLQVLDDSRRRFSDGDTGREPVRLADARVRLARFQLRNARLELSVAEDQAARLSRSVEQKRARLQVVEEDLQAPLEEIEGKRNRLKEERRRVEDEIQQARAALQDGMSGSLLEAQLDALRARVSAHERRLALLDMEDGDLEMAAEAWTLRYRKASGDLESGNDAATARRRLSAQLGDLVHEQDLTEAEEERLRAEIQRLERAADSAAEPEQARWLEATITTLTERIAQERDYQEELELRIVDHRRYLAAFTSESVTESLEGQLLSVGQALLNAWNFEVTTVDDRSVTVGKIVIALFLILAGALLSRFLAAALRRRVFDRLSMDASLAASLQTLTLYALVVIFFLTALRFVSIPLTALTFIGGALAIGIGFGSQNIVNNFISGLILMAERPIKVGDMIEVGGTYGRVERIGGRSTRVRSGNNTHVIVPNSTFLEKEVLNWTLSDKTIRTYVDVGVVYGSPAREVSKLLLRAVEGHGKVLKRPEPEVLFMNFGDSALEFRIYFWIEVRRILDRLVIQSNVRFRIDQLFQEAGITIAFPQRDVHLDAPGPLDIRLVRPEPEKTARRSPTRPKPPGGAAG